MTQSASYAQILKSSSIMGGVAAVGLLLGMVRVKFAAVLIGAAGAGLAANFSALQGLVSTLAGVGIQSSAVREVSAAFAKGDAQAIGRTVLTLRRICWLTGVLGMAALGLLGPWLSQLTFGTDAYRWDVAALGLVILLSNVSGGQAAILQGARRIGDLARVQTLSATLATGGSIALYFWLGLRGIVPAMVASAVVTLAVSTYWTRRVPVAPVRMTWQQSMDAAGDMARLGLAMMWTALLGSGIAYVTNALITQRVNLEAVGIYSAAFALSGMFVGFVLGAMGADYFPRLSGVADDAQAMRRLVNEQTEIGLLLATPGLLATMALAPWIIRIFYTAEFLPAVELLRWFVLGCLGRVISWPMGYVMLAMGKSKWFLFSETTSQLLHLGLIWSGLLFFGLQGVAVAFVLAYGIYIALLMGITARLIDFSWSGPCRALLVMACGATATCFLATQLLPEGLGGLVGAAIAAVAAVACLRGLVRRIGVQHRYLARVARVPGMRLVLGLPR